MSAESAHLSTFGAETEAEIRPTSRICRQQVDGLANSVGTNYKLAEGAVARSILQGAGPQIQQELDSVKPKSPPRGGDIVVTGGHRLSASCVFHGVLKKWNNGKDDAEAVSINVIVTDR